MKRILSILLIFVMLSLFSCHREQSARAMLCEFVALYGAEGVIYSPELSEGQEGFIPEGLVEKIFRFPEGICDNFALLLNARIDSPSECGIFVCRDGSECRLAEEICLERVGLLSSDKGFVKRRGRVVYYSTLSDPDRAERIFKEIIK